jgi:hypothetical protein
MLYIREALIWILVVLHYTSTDSIFVEAIFPIETLKCVNPLRVKEIFFPKRDFKNKQC